MHKAPTVDYPVGRSRFQARLLLVTLASVLGVHVLWFAHADGFGWRHGLGFSLTLATALVALHFWRQSPEGVLHWDGKSWWWESRGARTSGAVLPHLDLQNNLLLGFCAPSGLRYWLWLERGSAPSRWYALRRAVHAPGQVDADAEPGDDALAVSPYRRGGTARP